MDAGRNQAGGQVCVAVAGADGNGGMLMTDIKRRFYLKTDPDVFEFSWRGLKTFEIRFNDRDFEVGDSLVLRETVYSGEQMRNGYPLEYTGRQVEVEVNHILFGPVYGLLEGWVIMSVKMIWFGLIGEEDSQNDR